MRCAAKPSLICRHPSCRSRHRGGGALSLRHSRRPLWRHSFIAAIGWWVWPAPKSPATSGAAAAMSLTQPLVAPPLSIVVLPFANLSGDPKQQYFADGITEDLTTDLSRIADMLVISRDSAFTYKDKPVNAKQIGRELGVRYVLEGSVQRSGDA
jgi:adenylate cyclase